MAKRGRKMASKAKKTKNAPTIDNDTQKSNNWKIFLSDVIHTNDFVCALIRRDIESLTEEQKTHIYRICELFQSSVISVKFNTSCANTIVHIDALNLMDPCEERLLWSQLPQLINTDGSTYMELHNVNQEGQDVIVEKYILTDLYMSIQRCRYDNNQPLIINIQGTVSEEHII